MKTQNLKTKIQVFSENINLHQSALMCAMINKTRDLLESNEIKNNLSNIKEDEIRHLTISYFLLMLEEQQI